jgi:hypothetical protein
MGHIQFGDILEVNFTNSLRATSTLGGDTDALTDPSDYLTVASLDAFLNGFDPFTYSTAQLAIMNTNDKIFACRSIQDRTTIADYHPAQTARSS